MNDAFAIAVDYLRWFIRSTGAASPAEVKGGRFRGHTVRVHLERMRNITVDGGMDIDIVTAWREAKAARCGAHPDLVQKELFA